MCSTWARSISTNDSEMEIVDGKTGHLDEELQETYTILVC